jgi:uncharacterized protein
LYFLAPFIGWLVSGTIKFLINYIRFGNEAKSRIGNGGFPSTHTTVMVTPTFLIGLNEGFLSPIFGLAVAITYIIIIDATGLRRAVGNHAKLINEMVIKDKELNHKQYNRLRESMGHSVFEVIGGILTGILTATILNFLSDFLALREILF